MLTWDVALAYLDSCNTKLRADKNHPLTFRKDSALTRGSKNRLKPGTMRQSVWLMSAQCSWSQLELDPFMTMFRATLCEAWNNNFQLSYKTPSLVHTWALYNSKWAPNETLAAMSSQVGEWWVSSESRSECCSMCSKHSLATKSEPSMARIVHENMPSTS